MIIAVSNLKGGVGKTTITTNIAVCFAQRGRSVCIVDTDLGQQSSMEWASNRADKAGKVLHVPVFGIQVKQINREVEELQKRFDIVMIDGTPQLTEIADRTILASDIIIVPVAPSIYDFRGFEKFYERFEQLKGTKEAKGEQVLAYVLINKMNENTNLGKQIQEALEEYQIPKLKNRLVNRISYADSASVGMGVVEFKDRKAKEEIERLTDEIEEIMKSFK
jgi:chromosome partitioning protein